MANAYKTELDARDYVSWERNRDPSTRESLRLWTKPFPVDATLTTPETAEDLLLLDPGIPTINLCTNPSFEDPGAGSPTGMTADGATLTTEGTVVEYGSYALKITPDNSADNEGCYYDLGAFPAHVPLSVGVDLRDAAGGSEEALIQIQDDAGTVIKSGNTVTLSTSWQRSSCSISGNENNSGATLRVYIITGSQHGDVVYADAFQIETRFSPSAWVNPDLIDCEWDGTANASTSRRYRHLTDIRGGHLFFTRDVYIAYDRTADRDATLAKDRGEFVKAGTDWCLDHPVNIIKNISFINVLAGEQPRIYGLLWGV